MSVFSKSAVIMYSAKVLTYNALIVFYKHYNVIETFHDVSKQSARNVNTMYNYNYAGATTTTTKN